MIDSIASTIGVLNGSSWNSIGVTILDSSQTLHPSSVYLDHTDILYVVDEIPKYVVWRFSNKAVPLTVVAGQLSVSGSNASQLNFPQDVSVDRNGNIYVTDHFNARVQKYSNGCLTGITIAGITGTRGSVLNQLNGLRCLLLDNTESFIVVADSANHRIMRFPTNSTTGSNGTLLAGGNGAGNLISQLNYPWDISYRPEISSDLFITNHFGHSIIRWSPGSSSGTFVAGVPGISGSNATLLKQPIGIQIDRYMNIYVADQANHRIQLFCSNSRIGITIAGTGVAGNASNQLNAPRGIAFDSAMNLYVGDVANQRVQKFSKL